MGSGPGLGQPVGVCGGEQGWGDQKTGETAHFGTWEGDLGWKYGLHIPRSGVSSQMLRHNPCESHSIPCPPLLTGIPVRLCACGLHREISVKGRWP